MVMVPAMTVMMGHVQACCNAVVVIKILGNFKILQVHLRPRHRERKDWTSSPWMVMSRWKGFGLPRVSCRLLGYEAQVTGHQLHTIYVPCLLPFKHSFKLFNLILKTLRMKGQTALMDIYNIYICFWKKVALVIYSTSILIDSNTVIDFKWTTYKVALGRRWSENKCEVM